MKRVLPIVTLVFLAACGSGHSKATPATTTTGSSAPATSTTEPETSSSTTVTTASPTTNGTGTPGTTGSSGSTSGSSNNSSVQIKNFTFVGNSPVECNAPTTIEMKWTTTGAKAVEMDIDGGGAFTHYANGTHDEMLPLACDGNSHTYKLVATAPGITVDRSITIETTKI